jgi:hypothetical protein
VPTQLLGATGYLPSYQKGIQSLSLVTDRTCKNAIEPDGHFQLTQLRSLSWKGFISVRDGDILFKTLAANSDHLQFLELDAHEALTEQTHLKSYTGETVIRTRHSR